VGRGVRRSGEDERGIIADLRRDITADPELEQLIELVDVHRLG
jgi:hypothetical protein